MNIFKRLQAAYKTFNSGNWVDSDLPGNVMSSRIGNAFYVPGSRVNWDAVTGEIISCPAVQACFNTLFRNLPQAPPALRQKDSSGDMKAVVGHPLVKMLNKPCPLYDGATLRNMMAFSLFTAGDAFCTIERTKGLQAAELWWWPHNRVTIPPNTGEIIEYYLVTDMRGKQITVPAEDMVHLKYGLNPHDPRFGLAPLMSGKRPTYSLQLSSNYRANIMRNMGVAGKIVSAKDNTIEFDPIELKAKLDDQTKGDNVGSTVVTDYAVDVHYPGVTPKDMASDTFEDRDEALICALFGVPPQVALLLVGRLMKTDANWKEAREQFWEDCIMPLLGLIGSQLGDRLLPEFEVNPKVLETYELGFDYSDVRALQPDLDNLHTRAREDWMANLITLAEWKMETGRKPEPGDELLRYRDMAPAPSVDNQGNPVVPGAKPAAGKSITFPTWSTRIEAELAELEAMHRGSEGEVVLNGNGKGH